MTELIDLRKGDCQELIKTIPDESVNIILTDPPYLYLKGQKLEREFDEKALFAQWKRVLKKGGFVVMFGRGTSFYRWNYLLSEIGFEFKEEIVWDKRNSSSHLMALSRVHETVSVYVKGKGAINKVKVPFIEMNKFNSDRIAEAVYRLKTTFGNRETFDLLQNYYTTGEKPNHVDKVKGHCATNSGDSKSLNRVLQFAVSLEEGMNEKSIISEVRDHYDTLHPTQKPVSILRRLLALVVKSPNDVVLDCFAGSGSTGEACIEMKLNFIGFEIDDEYFGLAKDRLERAYRNRDTQLTIF